MWIYRIKNIKNDKSYIGQCIDEVNYRWREHRNSLRRNKHINCKLQRAWNKHGESSFTIEIISRHKFQHTLDAAEILNIKLYDSIKHGYNIAEGGQFNKGVTYRKIWNGVMAPDGTIYKRIENISKFGREHKLNPDKLRLVSRGIRYSYKGWKTLVREKHSFTDKKYLLMLGEKGRDNWKRRRLNRVPGQGNPARYDVKLLSPTGKVFGPIENLSKFSREHGIDVRKLLMVINKQRKSHKGWTIKI